MESAGIAGGGGLPWVQVGIGQHANHMMSLVRAKLENFIEAPRLP